MADRRCASSGPLRVPVLFLRGLRCSQKIFGHIMGTSARRANPTRRIRPRTVRVSSGCPASLRRTRGAGLLPNHRAPGRRHRLIRVSHRSLDHLEVAFEEPSLLRTGLAALDAAPRSTWHPLRFHTTFLLKGDRRKKSHHRCDKFVRFNPGESDAVSGRLK